MTRGGRGPRRLGLILAVALATMAAVPSADALIIRAPRGRHVGILPRTAATSRMRALAVSAAGSRRYHRRRHAHGGAPLRSGGSGSPVARAAVVGPGDPLVYHTGGPVVGPHRTYAIYWDPSGQQPFPSGYQSTVDQYLADVAADSGGHHNVYSIAAQYSGNGLSGVYSSTYSGLLTDVHAYPLDQSHGNGNGCGHATAKPGDPAYTYCLTDAQLQAELQTLITQNRWPGGQGAVYFLFLPPGVDECMGAGAESATNQCADADFCAYHDATGAQPSFSSSLYDVIPYADISGCRTGQSPNGSGGNSPADDAISIVSHEHIETITDPLLSSWYDINGNEIADKCEFDYGSPLGGPTLGEWNQVIAGHHYYIQQEWSNAAAGCAQRDLSAQFTVSAGGSASPARTYNFDASASTPAGGIASYAWNFGDGGSVSGASPTTSHTYAQGGAYSATLTVTDSAGDTSSATRQVTVASPSASFTISSSPGYVGQSIGFDGSSSTDPSGSVSSWTWSFGDGSAPTTSGGPTITHFFMHPGTYPVTLTVRDASGNGASVTRQALINAPISTSSQVQQPPPTFGPGFSGLTGTIGPGARTDVGLSRVGATQLVLSHGRLILRTGRALTCLTASSRCTVTVTVTARELATIAAAGGHRHSTVRTVAIATATLTAAPGGRALIALRLSSHGVTLMHRLHRLPVSLDLRARAGQGSQLRQALSTVLRLPRRPAAHVAHRR